jgi:hypothetical protein
VDRNAGLILFFFFRISRNLSVLPFGESSRTRNANIVRFWWATDTAITTIATLATT